MSNYLTVQDVQHLKKLFKAGHGIRASARILGISSNTASRYFRQARGKPRRCKCGQPLLHKGWCNFRVARSVNRQKFLMAFVQIKETTIERWYKHSRRIENALRNIEDRVGRSPEEIAHAKSQITDANIIVGYEFDAEGNAGRVQAVEASQENIDPILEKGIDRLPDEMRRLVQAIVDGASLQEAAQECGFDDDKMLLLLPRLQAAIAPMLGR